MERKVFTELMPGYSVQFGKGLYFKIGTLYLGESPHDEVWLMAKEVYELKDGELITHRNKLVVRYYLLASMVYMELFEFYSLDVFRNKLRLIAIEFLKQQNLPFEQARLHATLGAKDLIEERLLREMDVKKNLSYLSVKDFLMATNGVDDIVTMDPQCFRALAISLL